MTSPILDRFNILSWNIDGLQRKDFAARCEEIAAIIEVKKFTVVFLQEVVLEALEYFRKTLHSYTILGAQEAHASTTSSDKESFV